MILRLSSLVMFTLGSAAFAESTPSWDSCIAKPTRDCVFELALAEAEKGNETYSRELGKELSKRPDAEMRLTRIKENSVYKNTAVPTGYAKGLIEQKRYDDAFDYMVRSFSGNEVRDELVEIFLKQGDLERAARLAASAISVQESLRVTALVAKAYQAAGQTDEGSLLYLREVKKAYDGDAEDLPENACYVSIYAEGITITHGIELVPAEDAAMSAMSIEDTYDRETALKEGINCLIEGGQFRAAANIASLYDDPKDTQLNLMIIAIRAFESGDEKAGFRFADAIGEGESSWAVAYSNMADALMERGDIEYAEALIERTEIATDRINHSGRFHLAAAYLKAGDASKAKKVADRAWKDVLNTSRDKYRSPTYHMREMRPIAEIFPRKHVDAVLNNILEVQRAQDEPFKYEIWDLAPLLGQWGRAAEALEIIRAHSAEEDKGQWLAALFATMPEDGQN